MNSKPPVVTIERDADGVVQINVKCPEGGEAAAGQALVDAIRAYDATPTPATVTPPVCPRCGEVSTVTLEGAPWCKSCGCQHRYARPLEKTGVFAGMTDCPQNQPHLTYGYRDQFGHCELHVQDGEGPWLPVSCIGHVKGVK